MFDRPLTSEQAILINLIKGIVKGNVQYLNVLLTNAKLHLVTDLKRKRLKCWLEKNIIENFAAEICKDLPVRFSMQMTFLSFPPGLTQPMGWIPISIGYSENINAFPSTTTYAYIG